MSKWKEKTVQIIHTFQGLHYGDFYGLGSDGKLYRWNVTKGAWLKHWSEQDLPD